MLRAVVAEGNKTALVMRNNQPRLLRLGTDVNAATAAMNYTLLIQAFGGR